MKKKTTSTKKPAPKPVSKPKAPAKPKVALKPEFRTLISKDERGNLEYVMTIKKTKKGTKYRMFASDSDIWHEQARGMCLFEFTDTGNGIKLDKKYKMLDYAQANYMRIMLNIDNTDSHVPSKHEFIDTYDNNITYNT